MAGCFRALVSHCRSLSFNRERAFPKLLLTVILGISAFSTSSAAETNPAAIPGSIAAQPIRCSIAPNSRILCSAKVSKIASRSGRPKGEFRAAAGEINKITLPQKEIEIAGYFTFWGDTCTVASLGEWKNIIPPTHGTYATRIVPVLNHGPYCDGVTFDSNTLVYTWTDPDPASTAMDDWFAEWSGNQYSFDHDIHITPASVSIGSFYIGTGSLILYIAAPDDSVGSLELIFTGPSSNSIVPVDGEYPPGTHAIIVNRQPIKFGTYDRLTARWRAGPAPVDGKYDSPSPWRAYGVIRHTQYNTPSEAKCPDSPTKSWIFNEACEFTEITMRGKFRSQVVTNGTGRSLENGILKFSNKCKNSRPDGVTNKNSFLKVNVVTGSCNKPLKPSNQAAYPNPVNSPTGTPTCSDSTVLVKPNNSNHSVRGILDYCPACRDGQHIDNYSDQEHCSANAVGDLGTFWTVNIGENQ